MVPKPRFGESDSTFTEGFEIFFDQTQDPVISEAILNGSVRCLRCGRWCRSWHGFRVHFGKCHIKRSPKSRPNLNHPTLWDLKYGGRRLDL